MLNGHPPYKRTMWDYKNENYVSIIFDTAFRLLIGSEAFNKEILTINWSFSPIVLFSNCWV